MKRRILVVEDDAQLTNLLRLLLEPEYVVGWQPAVTRRWSPSANVPPTWCCSI